MTRKNVGNGNPYVKARHDAKMTTADLAQAAELSFSAIWNLERGLIANPNPRITEVLAEVGVEVRGIEAEYRAWRTGEAKATIKRFSVATAAK